MATLPFAASSEALFHIANHVRQAAVRTECKGLVPALYLCINSRSWDPVANRTIQYIPYEHFEVGWYQPAEIGDVQEIEVLGEKLFIHAATLDRLVGKKLVVQALDAGNSPHPGFQTTLLFAAPSVD